MQRVPCLTKSRPTTGARSGHPWSAAGRRRGGGPRGGRSGGVGAPDGLAGPVAAPPPDAPGSGVPGSASTHPTCRRPRPAAPSPGCRRAAACPGPRRRPSRSVLFGVLVVHAAPASSPRRYRPLPTCHRPCSGARPTRRPTRGRYSPGMAGRGWGGSVLTAVGVAAGVGAAQLGFGYGLGIINWAPVDTGAIEPSWSPWSRLGDLDRRRLHRRRRGLRPTAARTRSDAEAGATLSLRVRVHPRGGAPPARSARRSRRCWSRCRPRRRVGRLYRAAITFSPQTVAAGYAGRPAH